MRVTYLNGNYDPFLKVFPSWVAANFLQITVGNLLYPKMYRLRLYNWSKGLFFKKKTRKSNTLGLIKKYFTQWCYLKLYIFGYSKLNSIICKEISSAVYSYSYDKFLKYWIKFTILLRQRKKITPSYVSNQSNFDSKFFIVNMIQFFDEPFMT